MRTRQLRARLLTVLAIAVLGAGCTSATSLTNTSTATAVSTPVPAANLVVTRELVFAWEDPPGSSNIPFQVIIEFKNKGTGWAEMIPDMSARVFIMDPTGAVTIDYTGWLRDAFPEFVGPGQTGYLFGTTSSRNKKVADFASVEYSLGPGSLPGVQMPGSVSCRCFRSVASPGVKFEVNGIKWRTDDSHPGLLASGSVTTSNRIASAAVLVMCISGNGSILGATAQTYLGSLPPNQPTAFETANRTPPLKPSDCATSVGLLGQNGMHLGGD